jgi:DNA-binding CsgD family transcriptional regulator
MAENFINPPAQPGAPQNDPDPGTNQVSLTQREHEVIKLLAEGKSNKEAASSLGVSGRTVESHRNHIMRKLNFASFSDLVRFAVRNGIVQP